MQAFDTPDGLVGDDFLHFGLYQIKGTLLLDQLIVELMKKSCNLFWHLLQTPTKTGAKITDISQLGQDPDFLGRHPSRI